MKHKIKNNFILENKALYQSKLPWIIMLLIFTISIASTYITYAEKTKPFFTLANHDGFWDIYSNAISGDFLLPFVIILSAYIVGKDYSSGFIKNLFSSNNRFNNLIAKYITLIEVIIFMSIIILLSTICNTVLLVKSHGIGNLQTFFKTSIAELAVLFAAGSIIILIAYLTKKTSTALSFGLIYYLVFSNVIANILNKSIHKIIKIHDFNIKKYMLSGQFNYLIGNISNNTFARSILVSLSFITISILLTVLIIRKQDI